MSNPVKIRGSRSEITDRDDCATMMDDDLVLSSAAQSALAEFLAEKAAQESKLDIQTPDEPVSIDHFPEDWQVFLLLPVAYNKALPILVRR